MTWTVIHRARYVCNKCGARDVGWSDELPPKWAEGMPDSEPNRSTKISTEITTHLCPACRTS